MPPLILSNRGCELLFRVTRGRPGNSKLSLFTYGGLGGNGGIIFSHNECCAWRGRDWACLVEYSRMRLQLDAGRGRVRNRTAIESAFIGQNNTRDETQVPSVKVTAVKMTRIAVQDLQSTPPSLRTQGRVPRGLPRRSLHRPAGISIPPLEKRGDRHSARRSRSNHQLCIPDHLLEPVSAV